MAENKRTGLRRKLAAIIAADVAGYSALMGADEDGTVSDLKAHQAAIFPIITSYHGRVIDTAGDGILAEFASAISAVECALAIQAAMSDRNASAPPARGMQFRIGVNLGDVLDDGVKLFGDGINVAARLEAIAEPGGIVISEKVHQEVHGKVRADFNDLGTRVLKNITRPVRAFAWPLSAAASSLVGNGHHTKTRNPPLPDKPSLAVLPFANMSGDPEQEYFADGVVEDIITALSRVRWFFVIARNSSFTYRGRSVDIRQVGRELGVRYVLEGSIRKAGSRIRVTGQLIEAANGRHVWADRFDGDLADIFALQDRITESVVGAIEPTISRAEIERSSAKPTNDLDAYDLYMQALARYYTLTKSANDDALRLLSRALELDPTYSSAKALAALLYNVRVIQNWGNQTEVETGIRLAREAWADHADDPITLGRVGIVLAYLAHDYEVALAATDRALLLDPNGAAALRNSAWVRMWVGDWRVSVDHFKKAIRLNPLDPTMSGMETGLCFAYLVGACPEQAMRWARKALQTTPTYGAALRGLIIALVELGRGDEAVVVGQKLLTQDPKQTVTLAQRQHAQRDPQFRERIFAALRAVGIPE
ncbi:adenylate/guanylate cyclase domain-containing protein [Alsobacter sp. SYSU BS001988]